MGETPDQIRNEIDATRERMSDTADALAYKADVKSRVKESVGEKKDSVVGSISSGKDSVVGAADSLVSRVGGIVPDTDDMRGAAAKAGVSKENPLGLAVAGLAMGFVAGTLLPKTGTEDRTLGQLSDEVTDRAKEAAGEAIQRGKAVGQDALDAATDTLQQRGQAEAQQLTSSLQEQAQAIRESA